MSFPFRLALGALLILPAAASSLAQEDKAGSLIIDRPWSRATPAGAKVAAGYVTIRNIGSAPDRLVGGSADGIAGRVEIHEMAVINGVMRMRELSLGLPIPPGGQAELKPGGYHVMFMDLARPLREGERVAGTLVFEKAGAVPIEFEVQDIGARQPKQHH